MGEEAARILGAQHLPRQCGVGDEQVDHPHGDPERELHVGAAAQEAGTHAVVSEGGSSAVLATCLSQAVRQCEPAVADRIHGLSAISIQL